MRFPVLVSCMLLLAATRSGAEPPAALNLDEAVAIAVRNHPRATEALANQAGAEARIGQAQSAYYPQISLDADWSKGRTYFSPLNGIRSTEAYTAVATLRQTIYDFGRTGGAVESQRGGLDAARQAVALTRQDIALRARSAFYLLLAADKQVAAVEATLKSREEMLRQAKEFHAAGIRAKVDVAKAEASYYNARSALSRAETNREVARMEFATALGLKAPPNRPLAEPAPDAGMGGDLTGVQRLAMQRRAELRLIQAQITAARGTQRAAKSGHLPVLAGNADVGYADRNFPPEGNVWNVGVSLSVPIFSGYAVTSREQEASAQISALEARAEDARLAIVKEVETAWFAIRDAESRLEATAKERDAARETLALALGRYGEGVGSVIEVTDAQAQALSADTANIEAAYDIGIARARLTRAVGSE